MRVKACDSGVYGLRHSLGRLPRLIAGQGGGITGKRDKDMTMRKVLTGLSVFGLAMGVALPAAASVTWTGTLTATSDYKFRGISQSDNNPAIQGSFEIGHEGFAAGIWASSIDFAAIDPGADIEIDLYASYTHEFSENTSLTGKFTYYWYPGATTPDADYVEVAAALDHNFGKFSGTVQLAHTPDYYGGLDSATWFGAGLEVPLNDWLTASANAGHQWFDNNAGVGLNDYGHVDVGVTASWDILALDVRYIATDIDNVDCVNDGWCDNRFVVTLTVTKGSE
jgi:uncharacterized protein (TIGR02001 family)